MDEFLFVTINGRLLKTNTDLKLPRVRSKLIGDDSELSGLKDPECHLSPYGMLYNPYRYGKPAIESHEYFSILLGKLSEKKIDCSICTDLLLREERYDEALYFLLCLGHSQAMTLGSWDLVEEMPEFRGKVSRPVEEIFDDRLVTSETVEKVLQAFESYSGQRLEFAAIKELMHALCRFYAVMNDLRGSSTRTSQLRADVWSACFCDDLIDALQFGATYLRKRNVMILGEAGTGKQLVAQCIQAGTLGANYKPNPPQVACSAAEVYAPAFQAELFGVAKDAFTGVIERKGKIQLASEGSIFIDEIADLPIEVQAGLLRVIQEGQVTPTGGNETESVDVRYVTATNVDMRAAVENENFRKDLYARLGSIVIDVPPLRLRGPDVEDIAEAVFNKVMLSVWDPLTKKELTERFQKWLEKVEDEDDIEWPDNVRGLRREVEQLLFSRGDGIWWDYYRFIEDHIYLGVGPGTVRVEDEGIYVDLVKPDESESEQEIEVDEPLVTSEDMLVGEDSDSVRIPEALASLRMTYKQVRAWYAREVLKQVGGEKEEAAKRLRVSTKTLNTWLPDTVRRRRSSSGSTDSPPQEIDQDFPQEEVD